MNSGTKGAQGAYLGGQMASGSNAPMMFNPSLYNPGNFWRKNKTKPIKCCVQFWDFVFIRTTYYLFSRILKCIWGTIFYEVIGILSNGYSGFPEERPTGSPHEIKLLI